MVELPLNLGQIIEDVRVIELQVVRDQGPRTVVHELRALVEKRRVVLIGLDHKIAPAAEASRQPEILRHPADQEARLKPSVLQQPGEHAAGGGLAVGAGHRQHVAIDQQMLRQPLRPG